MIKVDVENMTITAPFLNNELSMKEMEEIHDIYERLKITQIMIDRGYTSSKAYELSRKVVK